MVQNILEWMKGIVILFVVLSAMMYLVPKEQYKRYIQFFIEMVVVIAVIAPVVQLVYAEEDFDDKIHYSQFWQELEHIQRDADQMDFVREDYYLSEYESAIEEDIRQMAEAGGYKAEQLEVALNDDYEVETVEMRITADLEYQGDETMDGTRLKEKLLSFYEISEEQLVLELK